MGDKFVGLSDFHIVLGKNQEGEDVVYVNVWYNDKDGTPHKETYKDWFDL